MSKLCKISQLGKVNNLKRQEININTKISKKKIKKYKSRTSKINGLSKLTGM